MAKRPQSKRGKYSRKIAAGRVSRAASKVLRDSRTSKTHKKSASSALSQRSAGGTMRSKSKTLVLSGTPKGVSRAPEIHAELQRQGRYFGDRGTRITRHDRDSH